MRRLLLVFTAMAVMVAMIAVSAMPAFATKPTSKEPVASGKYYCYDPITDNTVARNVPQGQTAQYTSQGDICER